MHGTCVDSMDVGLCKREVVSTTGRMRTVMGASKGERVGLMENLVVNGKYRIVAKSIIYTSPISKARFHLDSSDFTQDHTLI